MTYTSNDTTTTDGKNYGHNQPPPDTLLKADDLLQTFTRDGDGKYLTMAADVATLLAKIRGEVEGVAGVPKVIETDTENGLIAAFMEDLRQIDKTVDTSRVGEKAEYLKTIRMIDGYFGSLAERIGKTKEVLQARGNDYTRRKAAQARAEAQRLANIENQRLADIAAALERQQNAATEAAAAAARARKPANIDAHTVAAETAANNAAVLQIDEMVQAQKAEEASAATLASTAALTRTKFVSGHMASGRETLHVEIEDIEKVDLNLLRSWIKADIVLAALKKYAANNGNKIPAIHADRMTGAIVELRDNAHYR